MLMSKMIFTVSQQEYIYKLEKPSSLSSLSPLVYLHCLAAHMFLALCNCGRIYALADRSQNCPWIALLLQLIPARYQAVPRAIPDSG